MLKKLFVFILFVALVISISLPFATNFLKPLIKEKFLSAVQSSIGGEIELSGFDVSLLKGIIFLEGFKVKDPRHIKYYTAASADEVILDIDLPFTIFKKDLVFQKVSLKNLNVQIKNKERPISSAGVLAVPRQTPVAEIPPSKEVFTFNIVYIRELLIENSEFIFEDYSVAPSPMVIEFVNINGGFEKLYAQLGEDNIFMGTVHLKGQLNSAHEGLLNIDGSFAKARDDIDFDLDLSLEGVNLIRFSPYYSQTSFTILKEAKLDLRSQALCQKNSLNAYQDTRIYDIKLDDIAPTDKDTLFNLPAKTVIEFFKNSKGAVEFDFKLVGTINDPKFDAGPLIEKLLSEALNEKIMARLRALPRDVIKISEKTIKEGLTGEGFEHFEILKKNIKKAGKKIEKVIEEAEQAQ